MSKKIYQRLLILFCFAGGMPVHGGCPPSKPSWLAEPIPHLRALETRLYDEGETAKFDAESLRMLFASARAWGKCQHEERGISSVSVPETHGEELTQHFDWLWNLLSLVEGETLAEPRPDPFFLRDVPTLPLPQEWMSRKLLVLSFLFRIGSVGLTDHPRLAHEVLWGARRFALHDLQHARQLNKLLSLGKLDGRLHDVARKQHRTVVVKLRDALAEDVYRLEETSRELDLVFDAVHERRLDLLGTIKHILLNPGMSNSFPRTMGVLTDLMQVAQIEDALKVIDFLSRRSFVGFTLAHGKVSVAWCQWFWKDVQSLDPKSEAAQRLIEITENGARPADLPLLESKLGGAEALARYFPHIHRELYSGRVEGDSRSCRELVADFAQKLL